MAKFRRTILERTPGELSRRLAEAISLTIARRMGPGRWLT